MHIILEYYAYVLENMKIQYLFTELILSYAFACLVSVYIYTRYN